MPNCTKIDTGFRAEYEELQARMKTLAESNEDVFLPNPDPPGPVAYVFICMEPSLGGWAHSPEEAGAKVEAGFRNLVSSLEDFILHFSIRHYLCGPTQRYYVTDLAKGAMLVERAPVERAQRYDRWYGLLLEELDLVAAPGAHLFAVGRAVEQHLRGRSFPRPFTTLLHYSGQAARARAAGIVGHEANFEQFRGSVSLEGVPATGEDVLKESVPEIFQNETLARLARCQLSESRQQLIFSYKLAFAATVAARQQPVVTNPTAAPRAAPGD